MREDGRGTRGRGWWWTGVSIVALVTLTQAFTGTAQRHAAAGLSTEPAYALVPLIFGLATMIVAVVVSLATLPVHLRDDRRLITVSLAVGGVLVVVVAVGLATFFDYSTRNDGADLGGPFIAVLAGTLVATITMTVVGIAATSSATEAVAYLCAWFTTAVEAVLTGIAALDIGIGFSLVSDVVIAVAVVGVAGVVSSAIAEVWRSRRGGRTPNGVPRSWVEEFRRTH